MKAWLGALFSQVIVASWLALCAASTLATFFFHGWAGEARSISYIAAAIGFAWGNYKVFQKQQDEIWALRKSSKLQEPRTPDLRIAVEAGSRYILKPVQNVARGDFSGMFLEFHMMIENKGRRNSTVDDFQVEVLEINQKFTNLKPAEGLTYVQGRHCAHGMNPQGLSKTGLVKIDAESTTNRGTLTFYIPDVNLRTFVESNLLMDGPERKFPPLHCRLTLTDTINASATEAFEMPEQ